MELIDRIRAALKECGICSDEEFVAAVENMVELDIGIFTAPLREEEHEKKSA
jgi:hypothetical protein